MRIGFAAAEIPEPAFAQPVGSGRANSEGGSYLAAIVQMLDLHREFMLVDSPPGWFHGDSQLIDCIVSFFRFGL